MKTKLRLLVTGACGVTSRSVVRSLMISKVFKNEIEFIGTDVCDNLYGIYEKLYSRVYYVPAFNDMHYREVMEEIIEKEQIDAAIIIPEPEVLYWSEHPFNVKYLKIPPKFGRCVLSKKRLYECLDGMELAPKFQIVNNNAVLMDIEKIIFSYPFWVRDYSEGTTSGKGSFSPQNEKELKAWFTINHKIDHFMLSEYLPGRNLACFLLYSGRKLLKYGVAERIDYLMGKVAISGITGNTSKGKLLNDKGVVDVARKAVELVVSKTGETMNGIVVVDLKENKNGFPLVTEINIRHVAFTSSFANAGFNFSEYHLLCALGRDKELTPEKEMFYPKDNLILRDVDGLPIYLEHFGDLILGEAY